MILLVFIIMQFFLHRCLVSLDCIYNDSGAAHTMIAVELDNSVFIHQLGLIWTMEK